MCTILCPVAPQTLNILVLKCLLTGFLLSLDFKNVPKDISMLNISRWSHNAQLRSEKKDSAEKKKVWFKKASRFLNEWIWGPWETEVSTFQDPHLTELMSAVLFGWNPHTGTSDLLLFLPSALQSAQIWFLPYSDWNQNHGVGVFLHAIEGGVQAAHCIARLATSDHLDEGERKALAHASPRLYTVFAFLSVVALSHDIAGTRMPGVITTATDADTAQSDLIPLNPSQSALKIKWKELIWSARSLDKQILAHSFLHQKCKRKKNPQHSFEWNNISALETSSSTAHHKKESSVSWHSAKVTATPTSKENPNANLMGGIDR